MVLGKVRSVKVQEVNHLAICPLDFFDMSRSRCNMMTSGTRMDFAAHGRLVSAFWMECCRLDGFDCCGLGSLASQEWNSHGESE